MPNTDAWGIDDGYYDIYGGWHPTTADTYRAIRAAMSRMSSSSAGASNGPCDGTAYTLGDDVAARPPSQIAARVVRRGDRPILGRGCLVSEEGTATAIEGPLPPDLPCGYYMFAPEGAEQSTLLIIAPRSCPLPRRRMWGWSAQLYACRSLASWGIGDFADLHRLGRWATQAGAGVIMLNPLTASAPVVPVENSPYFAGSRRFLNPLYLRVEAVLGSERLGDRVAAAAEAARALNRQRRIDRDAVLQLKLNALRDLFVLWQNDPSEQIAAQLRAFADYQRQHAGELEQFAVYCAAAELWGGDWRRWPSEFRRSDSPAVARFAAERQQQVRFHQWLQWLADQQLSAAAEQIALIHDLPIGVDPGGADAWCWQDLLAEGCTIGAPPDGFNPAGQNWAMPPFVPHKLRQARYEPVRRTLAALLRRGAGLRIDHVMGLFRLFWIPQGAAPVDGAYVRYPYDELLAVLAVEAERAGAFIVGEDLGTVEPEVRQRLREWGILSFRLLYFEPQGPESYPPAAMAAVSTHDLPTLAAVWFGPSPPSADVPAFPINGRHSELRQHVCALTGLRGHEPFEQVVAAVYRRLGQAPCLLLLASLDDALAVRDQPNVPGTTTQWPNWSLALPGGIEALERSALAAAIARELNAAIGSKTNGPS